MKKTNPFMEMIAKKKETAKDKPMMKKVAAKAVKGHEKKLHGMAKGGGVEVKGKTKGKMVKMTKGGAC
jgi:tartrate dehydratase alpha subunit/fumarate hydratase class I-like protein